MMGDLQRTIGAVYRKDYPALDASLRSVDVNSRDAHGFAPLMHAVLAEDADPRMVAYLIEKGADANVAEDGQKWTALHFAARDQKEEIVRALLDGGAQVDASDSFGNTPLWRCVMNMSPNVSIIEQLVARGANPDKKNNSGVSPKDIARSTGDADVLGLLEGRRW